MENIGFEKEKVGIWPIHWKILKHPPLLNQESLPRWKSSNILVQRFRNKTEKNGNLEKLSSFDTLSHIPENILKL